MRIALVHDWLTGMRGGEKCLEVLCRRFPEARLFTLLHVGGTTSSAIERMAITTSRLQWFPGVGRYYRYLLPLMPAAVSRLRIPKDVDLVVSFSHAVAKSVKAPPGAQHVCYCFTPMRYAWHRRDDYFGPRGRLWNGPARALRNVLLNRIRRWDRATADRVTHFVAISRTVGERIRQCYGRPSRVVYPPVDTTFYTPADVPREDYYLYVGALVRYKRVDLAIEACNRLGRRLLVIGSGPDGRRLARLAGRHVRLLGWRSSEEIRDHMRRARALLFPANEDFGIVPVEAQACGMPVLAFGQGGATETVLPADDTRVGTGLFFGEQRWQAVFRAMRRFEAHPDWFSPELARSQAETFSTERFERDLVACLDEVLPASSRRLSHPPAGPRIRKAQRERVG